MANPVDQVWKIEGLDVPVRVYQEWRKNNRISITKDKVIIRVPKLGARVFNTTYENWAKNWLSEQLRTNQNLKDRFTPFSYTNGQIVRTAYHSYQIIISREDRLTSSAKLKTNKIIDIRLNHALSAIEEEKTIRTLIGRIIAQDSQPIVAQRIMELNKRFFQEKIVDIRLKNNKSNWGSCSNKGNINISVRAVFAPIEVQDYVFVHELAHLKELNHSSRYWEIVESVMPDYKQREKWLKKNGSLCDF
jgi:predicted metal-dependent hydrolase